MTGNKLKWIAMLTMLIDHAGVVLVWPIIMAHPEIHGTANDLNATGLVGLYFLMRTIGRIAFPIFIFLLIEGFSHTHNRISYFVRLLLFAAISEIPFDMATSLTAKDLRAGNVIEFGSQNVFFTLALGLLAITLIDTVDALCKDQSLRMISIVLLGLGALATAYVLQADYDVMGVAAIILAYAFRENKIKQMTACILALSVMSVLEVAAFAGLPFVLKYNGERGRGNKWLFYAFYPVHLLLLVMIRALCGNY